MAPVDDTLAAGTLDRPQPSGAGGQPDRELPPNERAAGASEPGTAPVDLGQASSPATGDGGSLPSAEAGPDTASPLDEPGVADAAPELDACVGSALRLDGATYATLLRPVQNDFTLELWIRTTSSLPGTMFFAGRSVIDGDIIGGIANDFSTRILNEHFVAGTGNPDVTLEGTSSVTTGEWIHVAATRQASNGQLRIIVNGVLESSVTLTNTAPLDGPSRLTLGGASDGFRFVGEMDEVRFWDVARTPEELRENMFEVLRGDEPGLVRYYRFEDADPALAADSSSSTRAATFVGTPRFVPSAALCAAP